MEPDLVRRLTEYTQREFTGEDGRADLAHASRALLRLQLGIDPALDSGPLPVKTRGMAIDRALDAAIKLYADKVDLNFLGTIRHLLRISLGVSPSESLTRERRYSMIAELRKAENI